MTKTTARGVAALFTGACLAAASFAATATQWQPRTVPDPIRAGGECRVNEVVSFGSYIYEWPSKYDQVFWPQVDGQLVWFCAGSGFAAFVGDFDGITDAQRTRIAAWLGEHYDPTRDHTPAAKWRLLEGAYALRDRDDAFRNRLLRVLAYVHETELKDADGARKYRERAFADARDALASGRATGQAALEYRFIVAAYARELGDAGADAALADLDRALAPLLAAPSSEDDDAETLVVETEADEAASKLADYAGYLHELRDDIPRIVPGGPLAPPTAPR